MRLPLTVPKKTAGFLKVLNHCYGMRIAEISPRSSWCFFNIPDDISVSLVRPTFPLSDPAVVFFIKKKNKLKKTEIYTSRWMA